MRHRILTVSAALAAAAALAPQQASAQTEPYLGTIQWFGYNFCPRGWAAADGSLISISSNTALFSLLGVNYGGDGRATFALPDLRGRAAIGVGQGPGLSPYVQGEQSGSETRTLSLAQMPAHTHATTVSATLRASPANGDNADPTGRVLANGRTARVYGAPPTSVAMEASSVAVTTTVSPAGGGQPFGVRDPYLGMTACIATQGIFPPRN